MISTNTSDGSMHSNNLHRLLHNLRRRRRHLHKQFHHRHCIQHLSRKDMSAMRLRAHQKFRLGLTSHTHTCRIHSRSASGSGAKL
jgi:hypothetical protein